jgi:hypothetical protein
VHTAKAVALIAVLAVVGIIVLAKSSTPSGKPASATTRTTVKTTTVTTVAAPTTTTTLVPPAHIKLQVLNGVGSGSYAGEWSAKLRASPGYDTLPPDNATATVASSVIYVITPGYENEAKSLARTVGLTEAAVNPTVPPPATAPLTITARTQANLVLVVGPDLTSTA